MEWEILIMVCNVYFRKIILVPFNKGCQYLLYLIKGDNTILKCATCKYWQQKGKIIEYYHVENENHLFQNNLILANVSLHSYSVIYELINVQCTNSQTDSSGPHKPNSSFFQWSQQFESNREMIHKTWTFCWIIMFMGFPNFSGWNPTVYSNIMVLMDLLHHSSGRQLPQFKSYICFRNTTLSTKWIW